MRELTSKVKIETATSVNRHLRQTLLEVLTCTFKVMLLVFSSSSDSWDIKGATLGVCVLGGSSVLCKGINLGGSKPLVVFEGVWIGEVVVDVVNVGIWLLPSFLMVSVISLSILFGSLVCYKGTYGIKKKIRFKKKLFFWFRSHLYGGTLPCFWNHQYLFIDVCPICDGPRFDCFDLWRLQMCRKSGFELCWWRSCF